MGEECKGDLIFVYETKMLALFNEALSEKIGILMESDEWFEDYTALMVEVIFVEDKMILRADESELRDIKTRMLEAARKNDAFLAEKIKASELNV